ncbi:MAG: glycoside hydrolase family 5 protein [Planctomycetaceae bacterium]
MPRLLPIRHFRSHFVLATLLFAVAARMNAQTSSVPASGAAAETTAENAAAFELMKSFQHGVNFGNFLEVPPDQNWGDNSTNDVDYRLVAEQGFDHVRLPTAWQHYTGPAPEFTIKPAFFKRVEEQVSLAEKHGLAIVINVHHFDEFISNPASQREKLMKIWEQLATRFRDRPLTVAFEILNEPHSTAGAAVMNDVLAEAVKRIRRIDARHLIIVGPDEWNGVRGLKNLVVPDDDRTAVTVHCYDPFLFTHQGATWTDGMADIRDVAYPEPGKRRVRAPDNVPDWIRRQVESYNRSVETQTAGVPAFQPSLEEAAAWGREHRRPIYVGEFGAIATARAEDRAAFYRDFRLTAEKLGLGWSMWDWKAGFHYWDKQANAPAPGMKAALFGDSGK